MTTETPKVPRKREIPRGLKIAGFVGLVAAAFVIGLLIRGGGGGGHGDHVHASPAAAAPVAAVVGQPQVYTCSMHPEIRSDGPGKCPICGMDLIPVAAEQDDADLGPRTLSLSPRAVALLNVQTVPVERRDVSAEVRLVGKIEPDETRLRYIAARVPGRIDRLHVDFTGVEVQPGAAMAELYSPELLAAQEELLQAHRAVQQAAGNEALQRTMQATLDATREKLRLWGLTADQISEIERAGEVRDHLTLHTDIGGVVIEKDAREGMYVETGQRIYTVADLSMLWVQLDAYESDLPWIRAGQAVTLTAQALPGETFEGAVDFISPVVNDQTRTVRVRVNVPNANNRLKPGMFVRAVLDASPAQRAQELPLVIPATAPLITGKRAVVYVALPDRERPAFEGRDVVLGPRVGRSFIVESGLSAGEMVVTNGNFKLDSELQLRGRISMMAPEGAGAPAHDHAHAAAPVADAPQMQAPLEFRQQLGAVVKAHFELVTALADDQPAKASAAAEKVREALDEVDMKLVQGAAHDAWMASHKQMDRALQQLAEAEDLRTQRKHFETFSDELRKAIGVFGIEDVAPLYVAVCPMVEGRKGYWLQEWKPITNPYWGAKMYRCGEIAHTLVEARDESR